MEVGATSKTAEYMAFFRALESMRPAEKRVLTDPFAACFLRASLAAAVRLARLPGIRRLVERYADSRIPGARTSAIARTWLIDQAWLRAGREQIKQFVLLGAGFDCRAYRLRESPGSVAYEVDHPAMLALKRSRLEKMLAEFPANVRYAGIDFNRERVDRVLAANGFDGEKPALFLWEGVTNYLTEEAVDTVLRFVADCAPGSRIVFTYIHKGLLDGSEAFFGGERIMRDVATIDEPWTFGLNPATLARFLETRHLMLEYDAGTREYRQECFGSRSARMRGYDFYHVAMAQVRAKNQP